MIKRLLKKLIPEVLINFYHFLLAHLAVIIYRHPSRKMIVIGVTGTSGKSTTCYLLSRMLEQMGYTVGVASTIQFKIGEKEWINDQKMTMVGRFQLQRLLSDMVNAKCRFAIVETTSEGIKQSRHKGIHYDVAVLTNLYPEHIESHGSFENYKAEKLKLFKKLEHDKVKVINGKAVEKTIIVNAQDEHANDFLDFNVKIKYTFSIGDQMNGNNKAVIADEITSNAQGLRFRVNSVLFQVPILGHHNISNCLAAICIGLSQGMNLNEMAKALRRVKAIPGRIERIDEGQSFVVIVDYAFEPRAMLKLYETIKDLKCNRIIHVFGGTGGGRDRSHHEKNGLFVGQHADIAVVTDEDPYDDDPMEIINSVAKGVEASEKCEVIKILNRQEAINKAVQLAQPNDIVLITGKGSEQAMVVAHEKHVPWDDRVAARKALKKYGHK